MENNRKEMLAQQINAQINNEEFAKAFVSAADAASVQKVLQEYGIHITLEEVNDIFVDGATSILNNQADELAEDQLDEVAGGGALRGTLRLAVSCAVGFGYGCLCGVCPAACAGANYVAGGLAIWTAAGYKKKGW